MSNQKDKLREYIQEHKPAFDSDFDAGKSWLLIHKRISHPAKPKARFNWYAAASLILLFAVAYLMIDRQQLNKELATISQVTIKGKPYSEIEHFYQSKIENTSFEIQRVSENKNIAVPLNLNDLQQKYEQLKLKLKKQGAQPQLVNAMVQNLQMQIEILEQQLNILQELDQYSKSKNQNNEKSI